MKKILYMFLAAAALCACTNLDEEIYSKISRDSFFSSEEQFVKYSARAYSTLQHLGTEKSLWTLIIQNTNEICVPINPNGKWWDDGRYYDVHVQNISPSNPLLENAWDFWANGVTACNDVLDTFINIDQDFDAKERAIAEVKVLRAFYYMCALDNWGSAPYSIDKSKGYPPKKDRAFLFEFVVKEITDNVAKLQKEVTPAYYGRVTQGMAYTLLAKMYLNAEKWIGTPMWAEAEAACKEVINGGQYSLAENYKDNFKVQNETCPEQIFAVPFSTTYTTSDHNAFIIFLSTLPANLCEPFNIHSEAWDGLVGEPDFMDSYDPADTRKADTWLYGQMYDVAGKALEIEPGVPYIIDPIFPESHFGRGLGAEEDESVRRGKLEGARIGKWTYQTDGRISGNGKIGMDNDFFIFRYADVVLMYVEALVRQGKATDAAEVADFKTIRTRAGLPAMSAADLTLENLYWERAHELALEGWSRQDMIRFDKFLEPWWNKPAMDESVLFLPFPKKAKTANPNLQ